MNHRMTECWGLARTSGDPPPNPLPKPGHPQQAAQHRGQAGLEYLQRRRLPSPSGQPGPGLRHPQSEEVLHRGVILQQLWLWLRALAIHTENNPWAKNNLLAPGNFIEWLRLEIYLWGFGGNPRAKGHSFHLLWSTLGFARSPARPLSPSPVPPQLQPPPLGCDKQQVTVRRCQMMPQTFQQQGHRAFLILMRFS